MVIPPGRRGALGEIQRSMPVRVGVTSLVACHVRKTFPLLRWDMSERYVVALIWWHCSSVSDSVLFQRVCRISWLATGLCDEFDDEHSTSFKVQPEDSS